MINLSGLWTGNLEGPQNSGSMAVKLSHDGSRLYGYGNFVEPQLGSYSYHIQGLVQAEEIKLFLTPDPRHSPNIVLGNIEATAKLDDKGKITGKWDSSIGTSGTFFLEKDVEQPTQKDPDPVKAIFVIHGHDDALKEKIARFIEKLELTAIILHEQVSQGMTIIEKFEEYSKKAGFAIALFTPDDVAYPMGQQSEGKPRARQNVVLEMGYFVGILGRDRVHILYKGDLELPSDILGVVYNKIDEAESWKMTLAKELKQAGYDIDLNKLIS
jgi:predicted nucleotide-binding protein